MKAAFVVFDGMTLLDFAGAYDALTRLRSMRFLPRFDWEVCARDASVRDDHGLEMTATHVASSLDGFDLLVVAGGISTRQLVHDADFVAWIRSARDVPLKSSVCTGSLLLGAAGFLSGHRATTHVQAFGDLARYCREVVPDRIVDEGRVVTAGGVSASIDLGLHLVGRIAGDETREAIASQMDYKSSLDP